jgi:formylglycine-generating enzyme required for sulfatase activity
MSQFGWLHLTDLHFGQKRAGPLWHSIRQSFFRDLAVAHEKTGPWQAVLFTGDLAFSGSAGEYDRLDQEVLDPLWEEMRRLGSRPVLLAVPGNHDLVRPTANPPSAALRILLERGMFSRIADEFYGHADCEYRQIASGAFANYMNWWAKSPYRPHKVQEGMLPGDWSATVPVGDLRIGVVGLNTTFLQLSGGDFTGCLAWDVRQLNAACTGRPDGDGASWSEDHDMCLLMTHQGPDWLDSFSREEYPEINPAGRFAFHLFGHMHELRVRAVSESGGKLVRYWQGSSLSGVEASTDGLRTVRAHGYAAGILSADQKTAEIRLWPRSAVRRDSGWQFVADTIGCELDEDNGTRPVTINRSAGNRGSRAPTLSPSIAALPKADTVIAGADGQWVDGINLLSRESASAESLSSQLWVLLDSGDLTRDEQGRVHYCLASLNGEVDRDAFFPRVGLDSAPRISARFCHIPGGRALVGSPDSEQGRDQDEQPGGVRLSAYLISDTTITNEDFLRFNPLHPIRRWDAVADADLTLHPAVRVTWWEAYLFCQWIGGRLPTETEWEYACRAGTQSPFWCGDELAPEEANFRHPACPHRTVPVRTSGSVNPWGLHDVHGNVWEWCLDHYAPDRASWFDIPDPVCRVPSQHRVARGGSWNDPARGCRSAYRNWFRPADRFDHIGFRVVVPSRNHLEPVGVAKS